ncbi:hypothetical protein EDWATA_03247 [Edwardsiella tarda ATCC 23685]|uniref:Uncharacterized protein n=1 Tax=Edwardsiella tarda ATCC 23685 TaxID=500638 RepID=D4F8Z2_EDWTA|nr:hypothetical protein EDWATA_03247 [Edwardsiella tarda ATCC 23685]
MCFFLCHSSVIILLRPAPEYPSPRRAADLWSASSVRKPILSV